MTDYKQWLGYLAIAISIITYSFYFIGIFRGKTKPHAFSWFVWGTLNVLGFAAVITSGGGIGAWVLGVNVITNYIIALIGFWQRHVVYDLYDWMALIGGLLGGLLWWLTKNPLAAIILISLSDGVAIIPTFRKGYRLPFEENISAFGFGLLYYVIALFALDSFSLTTSLYHFAIIAIDGSLVVMILLRRQQLTK